MALKIAVLPGDGIGKEVTAEAVKVLRAAVEGEQDLVLREGLIGGDAIDTKGDSLPPETLDLARDSDAILLGGAGVAADEQRAPSEMAGYGLLKLRKALTLFANLRPVTLYPELLDASTLKPEVVEGLDMLILRELNGDIYFGEPRGISKNEKNERVGINTMRYSESEIERIARVGFEAARKRRGKMCSVDKANVLETMSLWRQVVIEVHADYPDVELSHLFVDAASMALIRDPKQFDVIVTGNMFGDIISDAAAMLAGSIGMLPSASLGTGSFGLYEPVHGTAPDIAGQDIANPLAAILSASMMLRYSFSLTDAADRIEAGVRQVLANGLRTADLRHTGGRTVGTREMGDAVVEAVRRVKADGMAATETA